MKVLHAAWQSSEGIMRWVIIAVITAGIAMFSWGVESELEIIHNNAEPRQLSAHPADEKFTSSGIKGLYDEECVTDITRVISLPCSIMINDHVADVTLVGIEKHYILSLMETEASGKYDRFRARLLSGDVFSESGVMPYCVVNLAAYEQLGLSRSLSNENTYDKYINYSIYLGNDVGRFVGLFDDGSKDPMVYISLSAMKELFSEEIISADELWILAENAKAEEEVCNTSFGYRIITVPSHDESFSEEYTKMSAKVFLIAGTFLLVSSIIMICQNEKLRRLSACEASVDSRPIIILRIAIYFIIGIVFGLFFKWLGE